MKRKAASLSQLCNLEEEAKTEAGKAESDQAERREEKGGGSERKEANEGGSG